jgi:hypothetical protein
VVPHGRVKGNGFGAQDCSMVSVFSAIPTDHADVMRFQSSFELIVSGRQGVCSQAPAKNSHLGRDVSSPNEVPERSFTIWAAARASTITALVF